MASISKRDWIQWKPDPPSEPTDTLVLTTPGRHFVDIRLLKDHPDTPHPAGIRPLSHLDWVFAGTSSSTWRSTPSGENIAHATWRHTVDSRHADAGSVVDEGDVFPMAGDRVRECGRMVNPATGRMAEYEECWVDVPALPTGEVEEVEAEVVALVLGAEGGRERGVVVRVGRFCQGVVRSGEAVALERWVWEREGGWRRVVRMGELWLPCGVAMERERLEEGGTVQYEEQEWRVVELM